MALKSIDPRLVKYIIVEIFLDVCEPRRFYCQGGVISFAKSTPLERVYMQYKLFPFNPAEIELFAQIKRKFYRLCSLAFRVHESSRSSDQLNFVAW